MQINTSEGYRPLSPRQSVPASNDDGRYRGEWVLLGNHLVTPDFKLACELIAGHRDGTVKKDDFINHPMWKRKYSGLK